MNAVYISGIGVCLPNEPLNNTEIELVLGRIGGQASRSKQLILESNGIKSRYYAFDPITGEQTHTNRDLTVAAIRTVCAETSTPIESIDCLACGTAGPDQLLPNHAVMVHGDLGGHACEVAATIGVCVSGVTALKYAYMSVATGEAKKAIATASELTSRGFRADSSVHATTSEENDALEQNPILGFDAEFLRWMLSDGAAASLLTDEPLGTDLSLRIDWIDIFSLAHEAETCMYNGAEKQPDGSLRGWMEADSLQAAVAAGYFQLKQDVKVLWQNNLKLAEKSLALLLAKRKVSGSDYAWMLPHISSAYFWKPVAKVMAASGFVIPEERWFTNLSYKGNTGSAAIFIIIEEMMKSGRLKKGEKILCFVPESARFTFAFIQLTVV